jgi:hypothetical protein
MSTNATADLAPDNLPGPRAIDSMNHVVPADRGRVIVASSHGGL